nr:reverse transcriptase domain-containing protein [Tanacetum cinerariifolium]
MISTEARTKLCTLLKGNLDIFAWQSSDMTGVPRLIAKHRLDIREGYSPIRQKKRGQAPERANAIQVEVQTLVEAGILREVYYHDWLSNSVMARKHDGSWRMCIDFTDLNKVCLQDCYPFLEIDWKVKSLCGNPFKCFLDAYKGYHQLQMAGQDEENTAFHTSHRNLKIYVHDLVIKSHTETKLLRRRNVSRINDQSEKNKTVPRQDGGRVAAPIPTDNQREAEQAFKQLKQHIEKLPMLVAPKPKEELIMYLSASYEAISAVLMTERDAVQTLIYFVSRALQAPELNYTPMEKLVLALVCAAKRRWADTIKSQEGTKFTYTLRFQFIASNNEAKYEALIASLRIATQMGVHNVHMSIDSKLVANQVLGIYVAKEENMIKFWSKYLKKSIQEREIVTIVEEEGPTWMTPIIEYLRDETLPENQKEKRKLCIKARQYELLEGILHRSSFLKPWLSQGHVVWVFLANHASRRPGKVKFLIVAMDYFIKWIEAKVVATITGSQVKKFVWDNIVCHFGLPREIVSDNERANSLLGEGIKARQGEGNKNWLEELPHVLWAHRTMIKSSNDDTSFSLTYGTEAVIPTEIRMPTYRTSVVDAVHNDEELRLNLDLLKERRERAVIREAKAKLKMIKYYNGRVRYVTFRSGDFVYRSNNASHAVDGGKLGMEWEGPYEVTKALGDEAYKLRSINETVLLRTWNIANLKKCYL